MSYIIQNTQLDARLGLFDVMCNHSIWLLKRIIAHRMSSKFTLEDIKKELCTNIKRPPRIIFTQAHIHWLLAHELIKETHGHYTIRSEQLARDAIFAIESMWVFKILSETHHRFSPYIPHIVSHIFQWSSCDNPDDLHLFSPNVHHIEKLIEWEILVLHHEEDHESFHAFSDQALHLLGARRKERLIYIDERFNEKDGTHRLLL